MPARKLELQGKVFGDLTVEKVHHYNRKHGVMWQCRCACGNTHVVRASHLTAGTVHRCRECRFLDKSKGKGKLSTRYWNQVLNGAKRRGIEVSITQEYAWQLYIKQNKRCSLSGVEITFSYKASGTDGTASLDRIDSSKGYIEDNVQWVHKHVNRMMMDLPEKEFLDWCERIVAYKRKR